MTLPIWKRNALYVLWYEQRMYDGWCGRGTETNRLYHLAVCRDLRSILANFSAAHGSFSQIYAEMQSMLQNLTEMICKNKDSFAYYNYVQRGNLRCACIYDTEEKITSIEFSVVPTQTLNWYWKKNICSINGLKRESRRALRHRLSQLVGD